VNWETFLELHCIFEQGHIDLEILIRFWIKFFDQKLMGTVAEQEYMCLLEELIRGTALKKANKTTKMFAETFQRMLIAHDCLGENKEIINDHLEETFRKGKIDIMILSSALGKQRLDESFFDFK
jgi:hypothetical protein